LKLKPYFYGRRTAPNTTPSAIANPVAGAMVTTLRMMGVICFELPLHGAATGSMVRYSLHGASVNHGKFPP
jgi:hypothetical protein